MDTIDIVGTCFIVGVFCLLIGGMIGMSIGFCAQASHVAKQGVAKFWTDPKTGRKYLVKYDHDCNTTPTEQATI